MGFFERKAQPTKALETEGIDFSSYELGALGNDIRSILDVPGAIGQTAKYALTIPLVVAITTWIVFGSRMATWVLVPFSIITFGLSFFGSMVIGGFFVARRRLDIVAEASGRVVEVIGEMHADIVRVRDGHADTSVQQVAIGLLENAVFPAVFGTVTGTAENTLGPMSSVVTRMTKAPMALVQRTVISAVEALPDRRIGQLIDDTGDAVPVVSTAVAAVADQYGQLSGRLDEIVARVTRTALGSVLGFAILGFVPVVAWLAIGFLLS